jgi:uncharacterized membrane protein YebE (DUF533 family)
MSAIVQTILKAANKDGVLEPREYTAMAKAINVNIYSVEKFVDLLRANAIPSRGNLPCIVFAR